ncbi:MAG: ABC transporter permease [Treponema sp.]|nr:ABC transporter permease [Treponema sp.]
MKLNGELKAGAAVALAVAALSIISFFWVPHDCNRVDPVIRFLPPGWAHLLGTDNLGRDILSRIMTGGGNTLLLALCTVAAAAAAGGMLGLLAGYLGGITGKIIMRVIDTVNSFPGILLALFMVAVMDNGRFTLFIALFINFIPSYARVMRTGAIRYKNSAFVEAEKILGAGYMRIIFIHILPNLIPSLLSASVLGFSNAILAEASMSYLGMGVQPPEPSWGRMLYESQNYFFSAPWAAIAPGLFIMLTVVSFHLLGEGLRRRFGE